MLSIGAAAALLLVGLTAAALASGLTIADAVADPEETTGHRFLGIVSNVGILFWGAVVAVCLFAAVVVDPASDEGKEWRRFLLASAGVALLLLVDDFLLIHEFGDDIALSIVDFEPTRGRKNVIETAVFTLYGLVVLAYGMRFRNQLRRLDLRALLAALALLGLSFLIDMQLNRVIGIELSDGGDGPDLRSILEEGPKFVGIAFLVVFYARAGRRAIAESGPAALAPVDVQRPILPGRWLRWQR